MSAGGQFSLFAPARMEIAKSTDPVWSREYQREAHAGVFRELEAKRATLGVAFTGGGKTTIGASVARDWPGRVLWLAHRDFLIEQAAGRLMQLTREIVSIEKADLRADGSRIVAGSVQTLRGDRLRSWKPDHFGLIIYDEAHHALSPGGRAILEHFSGAKVLGITATPARADKIGAWNAFDSVAFEYGIDFGMSEGYFVPPVPIARFIESVHLEDVKTTAGDLNLGGLEEKIVKVAAPIAKATVEEMGDRPTIVYTPARSSAHAVAAVLNEMRPGSAVSVDMDTPDDVRKRILREFGKSIQYVCNCAIYTEGLDVPGARGIVIARPTKSQGLYIQMAGRGGRPLGVPELPTREERLAAIAASGKPNFILLDITGHAGRHTLVTAAGALGGKAAPDVKERARKILAEKPGTNLPDALSEAESQLAEEDRKRRAQLARAAIDARVTMRRKMFDPFARLGVADDAMPVEELERTATPVTEEDRAWMKRNRLKVTDKCTHGTVVALRRQSSRWFREGRAAFYQRDQLARLKCPVDVTFAQAQEMLKIARDNGKQRWPWVPRALTPEQVDSVMKREREPGEEG